ncbi:MAG: FAD-dependent oxidoreductase, partial [Candidatus Marinimicrobia bacterium]|nr:FAD-dependent oxidoreductase [Candidatus Neomarinimicrobiota bacterium]
MRTYDILIIGAGSVGLPTAYYFANKGVSVAVIEKEASVGRGQNKAAIGGIRATHSDPAKIAICQESIQQVSNMEKDHGYDVNWKQGGYLYPVYIKKDE